mgnify:FL=1
MSWEHFTDRRKDRKTVFSRKNTKYRRFLFTSDIIFAKIDTVIKRREALSERLGKHEGR